MTVLRTPDERFAGLPDFDFSPLYAEIDGGSLGPLRMHYLDEGSPEGLPVVLVHGEPTWSYMFRRTIAPLVSAGHRVIAPDLIGFGKSDKPSEISDYTYERHVSWLTSFCAGLELQGVVMLGHDWGGLLGLRLATEVDGLVHAYVASNHGYPTGDMPANDALRSWQHYAASVEEFDTGAIVARACASELEESVVSAYDAPYPDETFKAGARAFPALIPVTADDPSADQVRASRQILAESGMPFLTVYGEQDPIAGAADAMFHQLVPGSAGQPHARLVHAGHNMPEDAGETLGEIVAEFAQALR